MSEVSAIPLDKRRQFRHNECMAATGAMNKVAWTEYRVTWYDEWAGSDYSITPTTRNRQRAIEQMEQRRDHPDGGASNFRVEARRVEASEWNASGLLEYIER